MQILQAYLIAVHGLPNLSSCTTFPMFHMLTSQVFVRHAVHTSICSFSVFLGQGQLMHIHKTLDSIQRRSAQRSQQQRLEQEHMHAADMDTISLRAKVNSRCAYWSHAHIGHMLSIAVHNSSDITGKNATIRYQEVFPKIVIMSCVVGPQLSFIRAWNSLDNMW